MKQEINLQESIRANDFSLWMSSPMPMVTFGEYPGLYKYRMASEPLGDVDGFNPE